jgi:hypothetical protein
MIPRLSLIAALALAFDAHIGRAQSIPAVSGDFTVGDGPSSTHAGELWFRTANGYMSTLDLAVRIGGAGATRPVLLVGYAFDFRGDKETADCRPAPNGTCRSNFPALSGPSIGVGLRQALGRWLLVGIGAGVSSYRGRASFVEADASLRLLPHFAVVSELRYVDFPIAGQRAWLRPVKFGARAYW